MRLEWEITNLYIRNDSAHPGVSKVQVQQPSDETWRGLENKESVKKSAPKCALTPYYGEVSLGPIHSIPGTSLILFVLKASEYLLV